MVIIDFLLHGRIHLYYNTETAVWEEEQTKLFASFTASQQSKLSPFAQSALDYAADGVFIAVFVLYCYNEKKSFGGGL